jgi:hypothetical protein
MGTVRADRTAISNLENIAIKVEELARCLNASHGIFKATSLKRNV